MNRPDDTAVSDWDPELYERFEEFRSRPFWDLVELLEPSEPLDRVVDLGCGSGELTTALAERLGATDVVGVDTSPAMLDSASHLATECVRFRRDDIASWRDVDVDLIIANASLQWVPDHPSVLAGWWASLRPGGQLLVQVPANADHPSHTSSVVVGNREPFRSALGGVAPPDPVADNVLAPEAYSTLLHDLGFADPTVRLVVYAQEMPSSASIVEWVSATSLIRFFRRLPVDLHQRFVDAYREELLAAIGEHEPYLYTFKRILMAGTKSA